MQTRLILFSIIPLLLILTACTTNTKQTTQESPSPQSLPQTTPTEPITPTPTQTPATQPTNPTTSATTTQPPKTEIKSYSTGNTTTNINITSNGTNVKIITKNGQRYAQLNDKEVPLDENGCYNYDQNGTKIHACINNNKFTD